jgi:hypothetical protein
MSVRREIIAMTVRILANETSLVRKPEPFESFLNDLFGIESYDQRMARNIEVELDRVTDTVKRVNLNRKFNKIVQNV